HTFAASPPSISLLNVTLAGNVAGLDTNLPVNAGFGGNLYVSQGNPNGVHLRATILAGGSAGVVGTENCSVPTIGLVDSQGENIETTSPTQCELDGAGDQIGVNPLLAALSPANGGDPANGIPTATQALMLGSPAINSVNSGCP